MARSPLRIYRGLRRRMGPQARDVVVDRIKDGSVGVEVGVWKGDFAARALRRSKPAKISLVDPWFAFEQQDDVKGWHGNAAQAEMDAIHDKVLRRFAAPISLGKVEVLRMGSLEAVDRFEDGSLDWIYIDADHRYEGCRDDLAAWLPKLKVGGLLCGDDYGRTGWWDDGVTKAVAECIKHAPVHVVAIWRTQFVLRREA